MPFAAECFRTFQARATSWAIFEKFVLVPALHFFRKYGFWVTLQKFRKLAIRALLEPLFARKSFPVFAL